MRRRRRLWSPAFAFSVVGLAGVVTASQSWFQLRGGLLTNGLYVLALQLVIAALAVSAIDDLQDPRFADAEPGYWWQAKGAARTDGSVGLGRALWQFYLWHPVPAGLLACGLSMSLSLIAIGTLDGSVGVILGDTFGSALAAARVHGSELTLGSLLALTVALTAWRRATGLYGWVVGFTTGVVIAQVALDPGVYAGGTVAMWALFAAVLMACAGGYAVVHGLLSRRRRRVEPA